MVSSCANLYKKNIEKCFLGTGWITYDSTDIVIATSHVYIHMSWMKQ